MDLPRLPDEKIFKKNMAKVNVRRKLLVGSFLLPALILIVLIFVRSRHITTPPSSIPSVTAFSSTYAEWAAQIYTPISNGKEFRSKVESLPIEHTCDLSPLEEAGIRKAVSNFLMAFHSDSYEDYRAFRTPVPAQFNMSRIAAERKFCKEDWKNANHKVPDDPEGIFKRFWEVQYLNKYVPNPAKIKDSTIGQALMTGIAFKATDTKIGVEEVSDSLPNLKTYLDSHRHAGATLYPSSFVFERNCSGHF